MLWLGIFLGVSLEIIQFINLQRSFENQELDRVVDLASLLSVGMAFYLIFGFGMADGLLKTIVWLPLSILPIILVEIIAAPGHLRLRHLFYSLRRSTLPVADQTACLIYPYLVLTLISASMATTNYLLFVPSALIFSAYALFTMRPRDYVLGAWLALVVIAFGIGIGLSFGLYHLQSIIEDLVIEWMASVPPNPYHARTRIGDVGRIKLSDTIVWRIQTDRPLIEPLLLVDSIYTAFEGNTWRTLHDIFRPLEPVDQKGKYIFGKPLGPLASLYLNGYSENGRAILALPSATYSINGLSVGEVAVNSLGAVKITDAAPLIQLDLTYTPHFIARLSPTAADLEVPKSLEGLFARIRSEISLNSLTGVGIIAGVKNFFREQFSYSLFLGNQSGGKSLRDFLTNSRSGHCEYFATATTLLLRSFGIPTRYVTGYSVQEFSESEGQYVARRCHAHAWSQTYINGTWQNIDTTPEIWAMAEQKQRSPFVSVMDWISWRWYRYNEWRARKSGVSDYWLITVGGLFLSWVYWRLLRRPKILRGQIKLSNNARQVSNSAYLRMEESLKKAGYVRPIGETPLHWIQRLRQEGCPYITDTANALVSVYYVVKFCPNLELSGHLERLVENWKMEFEGK